MRKYAIPKVAYILLIMLIACLSIGYTYAYFSALSTANSTTSLGSIDIAWRDNNSLALMQTLFDDTKTTENEALSIALNSDLKLKRGDYTEITANNVSGKSSTVKLEMLNDKATIGAYCRIRIDASYKHAEDIEATPCEDGWIQLALADGTTNTLITSNGWFYHKATGSEYGYYYYGTKTTDTQTGTTTFKLTELKKGQGQVVADRLFLSADSPSEILGSSVKIVLTLEGIQTTNKAYEDVWGLR
ncbi:MAG: hypothetical protein IJ371_03760 [Clostridia bacterium]|nr:hypothetical protein [Clostridia bacterium]